MGNKLDKEVRVGICGLGTVGGATLKLLTGENSDEIRRRAGASINVSQIATRTLNHSQVDGIPCVGTDPFAVVNDPLVEVVIETIGGYDPAYQVLSLIHI